MYASGGTPEGNIEKYMGVPSISRDEFKLNEGNIGAVLDFSNYVKLETNPKQEAEFESAFNRSR